MRARVFVCDRENTDTGIIYLRFYIKHLKIKQVIQININKSRLLIFKLLNMKHVA